VTGFDRTYFLWGLVVAASMHDWYSAWSLSMALIVAMKIRALSSSLLRGDGAHEAQGPWREAHMDEMQRKIAAEQIICT
jgi:hypothetical protein